MKLLTVEEEAHLIARLQARDEQALALFYQSYKSSILFTVRRLVHSDEVAEDIFQEGMVKFWLSFASYDSQKGRLFTWAINICRNLAIDHLRLQRRAHEANQPLSPAIEGLAVEPGGFKPEHIGVREWLDLIAATDRPLLDLLYLQGYTYAEVAEALQLPLGTVKSRGRRLIYLLARAMR